MKLESTISEKAGFLYLAPIMDGVLLLLAFFVFGSGFVRMSGVSVDLPRSGSALRSAQQQHIITIQHGTPAKIFFNESRVDMVQLRANLQAGKQRTPRVTILADQSTSYGAVMEVAFQALEQGYEVAFGTQPLAR